LSCNNTFRRWRRASARFYHDEFSVNSPARFPHLLQSPLDSGAKKQWRSIVSLPARPEIYGIAQHFVVDARRALSGSPRERWTVIATIILVRIARVFLMQLWFSQLYGAEKVWGLQKPQFSSVRGRDDPKQGLPSPEAALHETPNPGIDWFVFFWEDVRPFPGWRFMGRTAFGQVRWIPA
jgi:hypothetical protein